MALVYLIRNSVNGKGYVGVTRFSAEVRFAQHIAAARRGEPWSLHRAIRKHGADHFAVEVIADGLSGAEAQALEIVEIARLGTLNPAGYNASLGGERMAGVPKTEDFRRAVSLALTGRPKSPEHVARVSAALIGKRHTPEARAKVAAARARQVFSPEAIERRAAKLRGRTHTAQAVANMAAAQKGRTVGPEHRARIARTLGALSDNDVRLIRANADGLTGKALAALFGVSQQTVCGVRKGRIYRHVQPTA